MIIMKTNISAKKTMSIQEVASAMGVSKQAVLARVRSELPDVKIKRGVALHLNEAEVTKISVAMKSNSQASLTVRTRLEKSLLIKQALIFQQEIIDDLEKENHQLQKNLRETMNLLENREKGLEMIQRIAEHDGFIMSDRDDMRALYGR